MTSQLTIIHPAANQSLLNIKEIWRFRQLFFILVWLSIKVRYKQAVLGIAWAVLQPLVLTILLTIIFGTLANIPSNGKPYSIVVLSGLVVWQFVSQALSQASMSVVSHSHLITRIYFPRVLLPMAAIVAAFFDSLFAFLLIGAMMLWFGIAPTIGIFVFIPMLAVTMITILGLSLWFSALYVPYRDVAHIIPFLLTVWMFASPVIYPSSLLPPGYEYLYALNPLVAVIDSSRWAFVGDHPPSLASVAISVAVALSFLGSGLWFFRHNEGTFADTV